jgi:hypothetical protein
MRHVGRNDTPLKAFLVVEPEPWMKRTRESVVLSLPESDAEVEPLKLDKAVWSIVDPSMIACLRGEVKRCGES